jgi:hypothetical protein
MCGLVPSGTIYSLHFTSRQQRQFKEKERHGQLQESPKEDPWTKSKRQAEVSDAAKDQGNRINLA